MTAISTKMKVKIIFVRSLYFENKAFSNFNEKVDGIKKDINSESEPILIG